MCVGVRLLEDPLQALVFTDATEAICVLLKVSVILAITNLVLEGLKTLSGRVIRQYDKDISRKVNKKLGDDKIRTQVQDQIIDATERICADKPTLFLMT